jgi:mono/diheme cytochrome c family protein
VHDIYNGTGTAGGMGGFVYTRDSAFAASNPESECGSCHQPEAWIEDPFSAMLPKESPLPGVVHGVSCDICHKIADIDISQPSFPGIFPGIVTFTRPSGPAFEQVQYGVLGDSTYVRPADMRGSYQPQLVAEVCAACHQDKNDPDEDGLFEEPNGVISEPTYLEWLESAYADENSPMYASCVDCHMPPYGGDEVCNKVFPPLLRDPSTVRSHEIRGTTAEYLENAVDVTVETALNGDTLQVDVALTNSAVGHYVPTGVTVRNMILLVEAWRESDGLALVSTGTQTIHDLGGVGDPALGYFGGLPGKFYAKVNHDAMGQGPTFFTDATGIQFDNRIPALVTDNTSYSFDVPAGGGVLNVKARVIYRRAFRFLVDAKGWTLDGHGNPLEDIIGPDFGHLMASASRTVNAASCAGQPAGTSCTDGNLCNGEETCDGADVCQPGTPLECSDGVSCNGAEICDPELGCMDGMPLDCSELDEECLEGVCQEASMSCLALSRCGHPVSSADAPVVASDALFALRAVVGAGVCPLCVCDVDASGVVVASDALRLLNAAVDDSTPVDCLAAP